MKKTRELEELLGLRHSAVAVTFQESPPEGVERVDRPALSGCSYWKYASEGQKFYTRAEDHYNCPVGAYTHGVDLPPERMKEFEGLVGTMVELSYLGADEVPWIPKRDEPFRFAVYAPLADADDVPDVVLLHGNARQLMLFAEAVHAAGITVDSKLVGRPTCAVIPEVMRSRGCVANLGCIGNRDYTDLGDNELYFAVPGNLIDALIEKLEKIVHANRELETFHRSRLEA